MAVFAQVFHNLNFLSSASRDRSKKPENYFVLSNFQSALAIGISFIGDLDTLIGYVIFGFWAQRIFTIMALLTIRYKSIPVHHEAIRIPTFL